MSRYKGPNVVKVSCNKELAPLRIDSANTLRNRINEFLASKEATGCRPRTMDTLRLVMKYLELYVGEHGLTSLKDWDVWLAKNRGLKAVSAILYTCKLKQFLYWCRRSGYMSRERLGELIDSINMPRMPTPGRPIIFTYKEYLKLKEEAEGTPLQWAFILAWHTGLALVDCCHLRWSNVDLEAMWITCARIKLVRLGAKAICEIPIITDSDLHQELVRLKGEYDKAKSNGTLRPCDEDYVSPELQALYSWKDTNPRQTMARLIRRVCGPGKVFHTFRRTFISNATNSGMPTALACKITAHSDPKMLMRYLNPDKEALRGWLEKTIQDAKTKGNK